MTDQAAVVPTPPPANTIPEAAVRAATEFGDADALVDGDRRVSFRDYLEGAKSVAAALIGAGRRKGDRVAIWAPNSADWAIAALGIHLAGCVLLPLNTRFTGREAAQMLDDADCDLLFTVSEFLGHRYPEALDAALRQDSLVLRKMPRRVLFGEPDFDEFLAGAVDSSTVNAAMAAIRPEDIATVLFTSGTTDRPKGAMLRHRALVHGYWYWSGITGLTAGDRFLVTNPFFHAFGLKVGLLSALLYGATVYPLAVFDVERVLDTIETVRITYYPGPPTVFQALLDHPDRDKHDLTSLRTSVVGATTIPGRVIERMFDELGFERVHVPYGFTEATGLGTMTRADDPTTVICSTAGRPVPGMEMTVERSDGSPANIDEIGEIVVRGDYVMAGYLDPTSGRPLPVEPTSGLHSGDLGRFTADGNLVVTGRIKDLIIVGGFNVYPAEVEAALCEHPAVVAAAVVGVPDERLGEVPVAYVTTRDPHADPAEITAWIRGRVANFKAPRQIRVVHELPMNASGKVLKALLRVDS